jgi:mercuric ion transport protein
MKDKLISLLAFLGSGGTLLCCVLPAVVVTFAGGGALSIFFSWLIPISQYKDWIFVVSGILLVVAAILILKPQSRFTCALLGGSGCEITGKFSRVVLWLSLGIYIVGLSFSYLLVPVLRLLE